MKQLEMAYAGSGSKRLCTELTFNLIQNYIPPPKISGSAPAPRCRLNCDCASAVQTRVP